MAAVAPPDRFTTRSAAPARGANGHTLWFLLAYYALAVVWGFRNVWSRQASALDLLMPVALAVSLGCWAVIDAHRRKRPIPALSVPWFFLLAMLLVPGYMVRTRRWRGVGWVALHSVGWYALATVAMHAVGTMMFGARWWRAMGL